MHSSVRGESVKFVSPVRIDGGERNVSVDHFTVSRWAIRFIPLLKNI